ncbi:uncharacterized protein PG986_005525 [Apiospora aurea]|uniref:Uncharacterized protein n=1 Tax=Apiospora aurea TaxID=335848 RepID=A0ABR1QHT9_9PEZI
MTLSRAIKPLETKRDRVTKLASHLAQTGRIRHIWLADAPPHYPSIYAASRVEKLLKEQIIKGREKRREARVSANPIADGRVPKTIQKLLDRWPLPLAVVAFTPRPTYFLPRNSPLRRAVAKGGGLSRLRLLFPRLPAGLGSAAQSRWDVFANSKSETATTAATTSPEENAYDHVYETEARAPVDGRMPPFSGPGRLMLWTVADLHQPPSQEYRDGRDNDTFSWPEALAQTTIRLLDQEFGIKARSDPSYSGLWVRRGRGDDAPERQIASIWPHVDEETNIVTAGITLNVGLPREVQVFTEEEKMKESATASWSGAQPFNPEDDTTSIAAELGAKPASFNPKDRLKSDIIRLGKTLPVRQLGAPPASEASAGRPVWYTRTLEDRAAAETCAPLGMDNYGISVAWSHELARVLRLRNARVDHHSDAGWTTREVAPAPEPSVPPSSSPSSDEFLRALHQQKEKKHALRRMPVRPRVYRTPAHDVGPDEQQPGEEAEVKHLEDAAATPGRIVNFERTMIKVLSHLKVSIGGKKLDTRNSDSYKEQSTARNSPATDIAKE